MVQPYFPLPATAQGTPPYPPPLHISTEADWKEPKIFDAQYTFKMPSSPEFRWKGQSQQIHKPETVTDQ